MLDDSGRVVENQHGWTMNERQDAIEETFNKLFERNGMPETEAEYMARIRNPKITAKERIKLTEYWLNKDK